MTTETNLSTIQARVNQLSHSPYLQQEVPAELKNLRDVLDKVGDLLKDDIPALIAEVKHLRSQNQGLEQENKRLRFGRTNHVAHVNSVVREK